LPEIKIQYEPPGDVARAFMLDDGFFRGIRGPVGSGKSTACCMDLAHYATSVQQPGPDGKRHTKTMVVRNTYPELKTTTIETWLQWFPERYFGRFVWTPPYTHYIRFGDLAWDVIFLALDREEDVAKLLSLEVTNGWANEARQLPKSIIDARTMRVGRFPRMMDGGPTRPYIIADTNPPKAEHWWPIISGEAPVPKYYTEEQARTMVKPPDWRFFNQPPAMIEQRDDRGFCSGWELNEQAENLANLTPGYYDRIIQGKTPQWIRVYCANQLGDDVQGKPVYPGWNDDFHTVEFDINPHLPILVGMDFGLTPAAMFCQSDERGPFDVFDELCFVDMSIEAFAEEIARRLFEWERRLEKTMELEFWGDPAGDSRSSFDPKGRSTFKILKDCGIHARPTYTNDPLIRVEGVTNLLSRVVNGVPALRVHPRCEKLRAGFSNGYRYKRRTGLEESYEDTPMKNEYSHPHDALQYAVLGAGRGPTRRRRASPAEPVVARVPYDVYNRPSALGRRDYRGRM